VVGGGLRMENFRVKILPAIYAVFLYLLTVILGLWNIYLLREIFLVIYAQFSYNVALASTLSMLVVLILSLVFLGFLIFSAEYHRKHFGQPESWKLFAQTLIIQVLIPIIAFFMQVQM
jgi:hypothetical protein